MTKSFIHFTSVSIFAARKSTRIKMIRLNKIYLLFFTLAFSGISLFSQTDGYVGDAVSGEKLWVSNNCGSCHQVYKKAVGPALKGVQDRHSVEWIIKWVQNNEALRKSGDAEALAIYEEYAGAAMNLFPNLTAPNIIDILAYIESVPDPATAVAAGPTAQGPAEEDNTTVFFLLTLVVIFAIIYLLLGKVKKSLLRSVIEKEAGSEESFAPKGIAKYLPSSWASMNPVILSLSVTTIIGLFGFSFLYWFGMNKIGVQQGYAPTQPIAYSHALHAGELKIDCKYCHHSAVKSKHAGIPSLNVCMNCHKVVHEGKESGTEEIAKIHEHVGYNKDKQVYNKDENGNRIEKPMVWNKAHNLPDHVFFSHQQHVHENTANIDCRQCHGPVETYTLGRVSSTEEINAYAETDEGIEKGIVKLTRPILTMGWCIECHNKKEIDLTSTGYYEEIHERLKNRPDAMSEIFKDKKVTAKELGGWECAKCHY